MSSPANFQKTVHASCVAVGKSAALITGASGSGKSVLALELISRGGILVADDQTILTAGPYGVTASCPDSISGQIEVRGVGILKAECLDNSQVRLVVNLDETETERLPRFREIDLLDHKIQLMNALDAAHFPSAILQILKGGRMA